MNPEELIERLTNLVEHALANDTSHAQMVAALKVTINLVELRRLYKSAA
jgi:hypothetical protein